MANQEEDQFQELIQDVAEGDPNETDEVIQARIMQAVEKTKDENAKEDAT